MRTTRHIHDDSHLQRTTGDRIARTCFSAASVPRIKAASCAFRRESNIGEDTAAPPLAAAAAAAAAAARARGLLPAASQRTSPAAAAAEPVGDGSPSSLSSDEEIETVLLSSNIDWESRSKSAGYRTGLRGGEWGILQSQATD